MADHNDSVPVSIYDCSVYPTPKIVSLWCFAVKTLLLLPLCVSVLYFRLRRRRPLTRTSHADFLTLHMVLLELTGILGAVLHVVGFYGRIEPVVTAGLVLSSVNLPGELLVLALTCVDRYLAVARPVTYLQLRHGNGVVGRNVSIAVVWILSFGFVGFTFLPRPALPFAQFCLFFVSVVVVSFCSAAVLRVLIRPGPGDTHGLRHRADQSKRRAFRIVVTIMLVQLFWLSGLLVCTSVQKVELLSRHKECLLQSAVSWFNIPCSLVLPALFLHKRIHQK